MFIKFLSGFFFITFISFAYLQLNDPDPIFWVVTYLIIALVSLLRLLDKQNKKMVLVVMVLVGGAMLFYLPGFWEWLFLPDKEEIFGEMVYKKSYIEETREFIGLGMGLGSLFYQYKVS